MNLQTFSAQVTALDNIVWGLPLIVAILATGILLTIMLRVRHAFNLRRAFYFMLHNEKGAKGDVTAFGALCTALSATIGTGNIVGVATAIASGGPGALFWMEVAAFFGMATKYAEGLLAVKYRETTPDGHMLGGPFYYIEKGLGKGWKWLALLFAAFGVLAGIMGIGTITQVNGITNAVQTAFDKIGPMTTWTILGTEHSLPCIVAGVLVTLAAGLVIIGGVKRIANVASVVVPFMAIFYVLCCLVLICVNATAIPKAVILIVKGAFNPQAVTGGVVGTMFIAVQKGVARGIFSNEAGLGSAPIAAAAAQTNEPVRQGLVCMLGTFIDTIVICSMTGLAIVVTGAWDPALKLEGGNVTIEAFQRGLPFLGDVFPAFLLTLSLLFFAFTTILGWNYYSEKCLEYIVGPTRKLPVYVFRVLYILAVFVGPYLTVSCVWDIADIFNGLMAFPNLVALVLLSPVVYKSTKSFISSLWVNAWTFEHIEAPGYDLASKFPR